MRKISEEDKRKPDHGSPLSTPRWVKMFGVLGLVLVLLLIILHLTGHSPFMHMSPMEHGGQKS